MGNSDPHVHVRQDVVQTDTAARNMLASLFGLVSDLPPEVSTGCGLTVPYATTSLLAEKVTCLPCRDYAHRRHLELAEQFERLGHLPGSPISGADADRAAELHRENAKRFAGH